jgi:hypothetical protein
LLACSLVLSGALQSGRQVLDGWAAQAEVMRSAVIKAFSSLSSLDRVVEDDAVVEKCQRLCQEHDLSPTDLAYKWEAHVDKVRARTAFCVFCAEPRVRHARPPPGRCGVCVRWPC